MSTTLAEFVNEGLFCRFPVTAQDGGADSHRRFVLSALMSRWGGGVGLVAVQLLGGLQITGCLACFVLVGMFFASVGCGCSRAVTQVCSSEMKLFAELPGDSPWTVLLKRTKGKR